jgi:hypothetical protein
LAGSVRPGRLPCAGRPVERTTVREGATTIVSSSWLIRSIDFQRGTSFSWSSSNAVLGVLDGAAVLTRRIIDLSTSRVERG